MKFYIHYFILDNIILFKTKYKIYKYFFLFKFEIKNVIFYLINY